MDMRLLGLALGCVAGISLGACFSDPTTVGAACSTDADCGDLVCVNGACAVAEDNTGGADATSTGSDMTTGGTAAQTSNDTTADDGPDDTSSDDGVPEGCGNGQTDPDEDCDDDNDDPFDGCDLCSSSPTLELEVIEDLGGADLARAVTLVDPDTAYIVGSTEAGDRELFAASLNLDSGDLEVVPLSNAPSTGEDEALLTIVESPSGLTAGGLSSGTAAASARLLLRWPIGGKLVTEIPFIASMQPNNEEVRAAEYLPGSGNVVVGGTVSTGGTLRGFTREIDSADSLVGANLIYDSGFGDSSAINAIARGDDGRVILAGTFSAGGTPRGFSAQYTPGDIPAPIPFGPAKGGSEARAVAAASGVDAVAGLLITPEGTTRAHVERRQGGPPEVWSFDEGSSRFNGVALRSNGGVVAVGSTVAGGDSDLLILVLDERMLPSEIITIDFGPDDNALAITPVGESFLVVGTADGDVLAQIWTFPG